MSAMKRDVLIIRFNPSFLSFHYLHGPIALLTPFAVTTFTFEKKMSLTETVERRTEQSNPARSLSPSPPPCHTITIGSCTAAIISPSFLMFTLATVTVHGPAFGVLYQPLSRLIVPRCPLFTVARQFEFIHRIAPLLHCSRFLINQHPLSPTLEQRWLRTVDHSSVPSLTFTPHILSRCPENDRLEHCAIYSFRTCCVKLHTSNSAHPHQRTNLASGTTPALLRLLKAYKPIATVGVVTFLIISKSSLINTLKRAKESHSVQLQRGLRIVDSPGVIFEDDDSIQDQKVSSVLLCNVVKPNDVDDPISDCHELRKSLHGTQTERLMKIYDLPTFSSTLEFLTILAPLSTGRILKVGTPDILSALPSLHAAHIPSTRPGSGGQVAPGTEMTGQAQIVNAPGAPFVLEGLLGEADAEAMDAEPDSESGADAIGMDVENDAEGAAVIADGGMIVDNDDTANNIGTLEKDANANAVTHQTPADVEETEFDTEMAQVPKPLRRIAGRSASLPPQQSLCPVRRAERQARRRHERALLHKASEGVGRMQIDS
ncbi:hypothetical protein F5888DRAFT_1868237 [Russula emetica]|nr:hypothetical protein F5888DRAFT_1868237 [Russula emetica]